MISIILADDHHIVRDGIKSLLSADCTFNIVGEAANGDEVLKLLRHSVVDVDILLTDMTMPGLGGLELIKSLKIASPGTRIIVLSMTDHEKYVISAFTAGAMGYLLKNISPQELIFAIKHVHGEGRYLCSELALRFFDRLFHLPKDNGAEVISDHDFSKREIEVLSLIADGFTNQEISDKLFTSKRTVEGHRQNMIDKTKARNTASLIRLAILNGIIC